MGVTVATFVITGAIAAVIMYLLMRSRNLPTGVFRPPFRFTPKPKSRENTIRGSMARRLRRLTKSSAVKKLTIIWAMVACSPISSAGISVQGTRTGGEPMVFASISSAVANMESRRRAGKIMGVTVATFVITGAIAAAYTRHRG